ncbi:MAG: hypothetical protein ACI814_004528, partial [Mariniblastus sp.]
GLPGRLGLPELPGLCFAAFPPIAPFALLESRKLVSKTSIFGQITT